MGLDSDLPLSGSGSDDGNFGFAFNNVNFSDRLLRIEITRGGGEVSRSSIDDRVRDRKRRREDVKNNETQKGFFFFSFNLTRLVYDFVRFWGFGKMIGYIGSCT